MNKTNNKISKYNQNTLTLHIRLTKKCNADCSYCSSYEKNPDDLLKLPDLKLLTANLNSFIQKYKIGGERKLAVVQYIGGEILTIPTEYLKSYTAEIKRSLLELFTEVKDGAQTNLIGSSRKIAELETLFSGNLGTSYDFHTEQRTLNGDHKKYKTIFIKNIKDYKVTNGKKIPGIVVLDKKMLPFIERQVDELYRDKTSFTLRKAFDAGMTAEKVTTVEAIRVFTDVYRSWVMKQPIIAEPFNTMLKRRLNTKKNNIKEEEVGCPFQSNCMENSLNIEPNGDIYLCQDMADTKLYKIGNLLNYSVDEQIISKLKNRKNNLSEECISCNYLEECQGGCLKESLEEGYGLYGKSSMCNVWKELFSLMDNDIEKYGVSELSNWLERINH